MPPRRANQVTNYPNGATSTIFSLDDAAVSGSRSTRTSTRQASNAAATARPTRSSATNDRSTVAAATTEARATRSSRAVNTTGGKQRSSSVDSPRARELPILSIPPVMSNAPTGVTLPPVIEEDAPRGSSPPLPPDFSPLGAPVTPEPTQQRARRRWHVHFDSPDAEEIDVTNLSHDSTSPSAQYIPTTPENPTHRTPRSTARAQARARARAQSPSPSEHRRDAADRPATIGRAAFHGSHPRTNPINTRNKSGTKKQRADDVWDFFDRGSDDGAICCRYCLDDLDSGKTVPDYRYSKTTATDGLRQHLTKHHLKAWIKTCIERNIPLQSKAAQAAVHLYNEACGHGTSNEGGAGGDDSSSQLPFSIDSLVDAILVFVVADDQSIRVIDSQFFRNIILHCRQELKDSDLPHSDSLRSRIMETVKEYLDKLSKEMKDAEGAISFTEDLWTDQSQRSFMAITAHWIQAKSVQTSTGIQRRLIQRADLIGFQLVTGRHTGEHVANALFDVFKRLDLLDKIGWITSDNAGNNDTCMRALGRLFENLELGYEWDPHDQRIRCFAHIVNLACKEVIASLSIMANELVPRLRDLCRAIRGSGIRREYFRKCSRQATRTQIELELILDADIRWSSTYLMIDRALQLRLAISRFMTCDDWRDLAQVHHISDDHWDLLKDMNKVLHIAFQFQQALSSERTPTLCAAIPAFEAMSKRWTALQGELPHLEDAIDAGLRKIDEYLNKVRRIPAYTYAMAINPAMKLHFFSMARPAEYTAAKNLFVLAVQEYQDDLSSTASASGATSRATESPDSFNWITETLLGSVAVAAPQTIQQEVDLYLSEAVVSSKSTLEYWEENRKRYPTIYKLAMDVLPIQGTSVPSERIFSSAKETITARRSRLGPDLMEALQILKFAYKAKGRLDFSEGLSMEHHLALLEVLTDEAMA